MADRHYNSKMKLKYAKNLLPAEDGMKKIAAITWSPNHARAAVATADRVIHLYDDNLEKKDRFPTRPAQKGQNNFVVRALAFSPDGVRLAVAQSDNIVFVYKLGAQWGERKSICNKFPQTSAVTCMVWPRTKMNEIYFGLAQGKVKMGYLKNNKASTLFSADSYVASITSNQSGNNILSGHIDGSIYMYSSDSRSFMKLVMHPSVPYALDWGEHICAAGNDGKVIFYTDDGNVFQRFDYSYDSTVKQFTMACFNPAGDSVILGNFNKFFVFGFNPRRPEWTEKTAKHIENLYSVTALCWKPDGTRFVIGSLCGSVDVFEICNRKVRYKGKFEFSYVSVSQVIVSELATGLKVVIKSDYGYQITKINIYQDKFLVAQTGLTLLLGDFQSSRISEIQWRGSGKEKYDFSNPGICMIFNAGELVLVEYGNNQILGTCRTEQMSPHLISARINYSKSRTDQDSIKVIAFLLDPTTLCVQDLKTHNSVALINHDSRIDFLELNPSGTKLLFRDKRRQLHLFNIKTQTRSTLLNFCSYVQWVPNSDVVVAQSRNNLNVWYNIDDPDKVTVYNIKGEVEEIERNKNGTEVIVNQGTGTASYALDEHMIGFGYALQSRDLEKAVQILQPLENTPQSEANWKALAQKALQEQNLVVAQHCFAALGDVAKSRFLHNINKLAQKHLHQTGQNGIYSYLVQAKLAMLQKQFHRAQAILLDQNDVEQAMEMYQELHRWDQIIAIARKRNHPKLPDLISTYFSWLLQSNQEEKAAQVTEQGGDYEGAINLYLKGKLPAKAAGVVSRYGINSSAILQKVAAALQSAEMHQKAGEFFEKLNMPDKALEAYVRGNAYRKAVDLARRHYPTYIDKLQEKWGDYLVSQKQMEASINHFIDANAHQKAIQAAISARQWTKAVQLLGSQPNEIAKPYYRQIAKYYADVRQLEQAEKFYMSAGAVYDVFEMYTSNNKWDIAYRFACRHMSDTEVTVLYTKQAQKLENEGAFKDAQRLYLTVKEADMAIAMYKRNGNIQAMMKLIYKYRKDLAQNTHLGLAKQYEQEGKLRQSEHHYIEAQAWTLAIELYKKRAIWDQALRVARAFGGPKQIIEIAKVWAKSESIGGRGVRPSSLLVGQNLTEAALQLEVEEGNYQQAFRLAENDLRHKLPDVHLSYALYLEDQGRLKEAEQEFIKAGKVEQAIHMYQHTNDFHSALRLVKQFRPELQTEVLTAQAKFYIEREDYRKAQQSYLAGSMPKQAIRMYEQARMFDDAIRLAQQFIPQYVKTLIAKKGTTNNLDQLRQNARQYEQNRDYINAINCYLDITEDATHDADILQQCWERAVHLAMNHDKGRLHSIVVNVGKRLMNIKKYQEAADMYAGIGQYEEAVQCFVKAADFRKAKELVEQIRDSEIAPRLRQMVDMEQRKYLGNQGNYQDMMKIDANAGVKMIVESGNWERALQQAKNAGPHILNDTLMQYTRKLTEQGKFSDALRAFTMYGSPNSESFMQIYKTLCLEVLAECEQSQTHDLRTVLKNLLDNMYDKNSVSYREFSHYYLIAQLLYLKKVYKQKGQTGIYAKACVSLVRYTDEVRCDKAFYEAGMACKDENWLNMAFVLLSRYLDIADAIDDPENGAANLADSSDFDCSDIPVNDIPLPQSNFLPEHQRDALRDKVLDISMDQRVEQRLSMRNCDRCGSEIFAAALRCVSCGQTWPPCLVTGYPVLPQTQVACSNCNRPANKSDWNAYLTSNSNCPWCSSVQSQAF